MSATTYTQKYATTDNQTAGAFLFDTISAQDVAISKIAFGALGSITYVDASNPLPVTFSGTVTVTGAGGTFPVTDSGGSLTVDAPVGTPVFVRLSDGSSAISTLPVSLASVPSHAVTNAGTFAVQVDGSALTSLQLIDDVVHSGDASLSKYAVIGAVLDDSSTSTVTENNANSLRMSSRRALLVEGVASGTSVNVALASSSATVTVTGAGGTFPVTDSGGSLTVDAPVGTPVFVRLSDGSSAISTLPVSIASTVTIAGAVTNAGTFAVQDSQVVADNAAFTDGTTKLFTAGYIFDETAGTALTENDAAAARVDSKRAVVGVIEDETTRGRRATVTAANALKVDNSGVTQPISGTVTANAGTGTFTVTGAVTNAGTFATQESGALLTSAQLIDDIVYTDDTSTHATGTSKGALFMAAATPTDSAVNANDIGAVAMTTDRKLHVSVQDALPAGTNAIGKLSSNSGVTIGAVEIASAQTLATVTTVTTVTTCSTVTTVSTLTGSGIAHDGVDSGNPHKVGARCALTLSDDTIVANADRTDNVSDGDGTLLVRNQFPLADLISERVSNTDGASTAFSNFGATANTRNVVTAIVLWNSSATAGYVDFRDGTAGSILFTVPIPAGGGAVLPAGATPYFKTTANTALAFDVSAALTTVYISISGFRSKVV